MPALAVLQLIARESLTMARSFELGECVRIPDGRIGRVRDRQHGLVRVRVRRRTSATHQFLHFRPSELTRVACPEGWMSPAGYTRYLRTTLAKMRDRERAVASKPQKSAKKRPVKIPRRRT
jgi:hypothetical protein